MTVSGIYLPVCSYVVNTCLQAPAGNPGSYSGSVSLLHSSGYHFHSFLGPSETQCSTSPPEKHIQEEEKYV